ncbi:MAG: hypothetical protein Q9159_004008 [Coniocarpon cinnabarinum]
MGLSIRITSMANDARHLSCNFALRLPLTNLFLPILIPTLYLWIVDTLALRRGTWIIEKDTVLNIELWQGLDFEYVVPNRGTRLAREDDADSRYREAFFFLITNCMVVFGQIAFDYTLTLIHTYPELAPGTSYPSPVKAVRILLANTSLLSGHSSYDAGRIRSLQQAVARLRQKSRSFYLASATFDGPLRIELIRLYSFCRVADDLVDSAESTAEARAWISRLREFLDETLKDPSEAERRKRSSQFPQYARHALIGLPLEKLSRRPLQDLLHGFETDLQFDELGTSGSGHWPIKNVSDLMQYGYGVAGTVAELCLDLVFYYHGQELTDEQKNHIRAAGNTMGKALQTVNITRDVQVDAEMGRVYLPTDWLKEHDLTPKAVLQNPLLPSLSQLRVRLLDQAFALYEEARPAIALLPIEAKGPMRVAVESYMEIGRRLMDKRYMVQPGRATVPLWRRVRTAVRALMHGGS